MADYAPITHIDFKANGAPIIKGTRLKVIFLAEFLDDPEWPVVRICEELGLTPAQVHAAWSYYYDHQPQLDAQRASEAKIQRPDSAEYKAQVRAMKARRGNDT